MKNKKHLDLVRAREGALNDLQRKRQFLLRTGKRPPTKVNSWTVAHRQWLDTVKYDLYAQQLVLQEYIHSVDQAQERLKYLEQETIVVGCSSEHAPVIAALRALRKTGNDHVRRIIVESAWHYLKPPVVGRALRKRQEGLPESIKAISWKAQNRLNSKFRRLLGRDKPRQTAVVAVARELLGFIWSIALHAKVEQEKAA